MNLLRVRGKGMRGCGVLVWSAIICIIMLYTHIRAFQLGIENIPSSLIASFTHQQIGLITNHTGKDQHGNRTVDILRQKGFHIGCILAPEHGFDGKQQAGKSVAHSIDPTTGITIASMYCSGGDHVTAGKHVDPAIMSKLDALFFDIQDVGMRHYTYISTLLCALEAAARHEKPLIVFDRPNLLGAHMEGPLVDDHLKSFISIAPIPLRHGMTMAELAQYFNKHVLQKPASLRVVTMKDYKRTMEAPFLGPLSPNVASVAAVYGYSFLGLLGEIAPFHTGVGTPDAFQIIMIPKDSKISLHAWDTVKTILSKHGIASSYHTATKRGRDYTGLKLHITQGMKVASFALLLELLSFFSNAGLRVAYSATFDKAVGTNKLQEAYKGICSMGDLKKMVNAQLEQFFIKAQPLFLYEPLPEMKKLW